MIQFLLVFLGAFSWTFLEYVIHRWLGHDRRTLPNPFGTEHLRHHIEGNYFAPVWKKSMAAVVVTAALLGAATLVAGPSLALAYVSGLMGMYVLYEILHRLEHIWAGMGPYGRWARRHHFYHHFVDAKCNHGVTTPLWDLVFGTYRRPGLIRVPRSLCMDWILDPATGDVRSELRDSYELR